MSHHLHDAIEIGR